MRLCPYSTEFCNDWDCPNATGASQERKELRDTDHGYDCMCLCNHSDEDECPSDCAGDI